MQTLELTAFGLEALALTEYSSAQPTPSAGEVVLAMHAASVNARDCQIALGEFSAEVEFPIIPLSDGAGTVVAVGEAVTEFSLGDLATPTFFPLWQDGEALDNERSISVGLESAGVAQPYFCCPAESLVRAAPHLTAAEAACLPCAGVTAWSALQVASIREQQAPWVLVQGTGGVATLGILLAKAMGAQVIVISSSDERLEQARALGAAVCINYRSEANWGELAFAHAGHGVDLVLETGGTGTMAQSLQAIRHGGHIAVIGYMDGIELGTTVFPLIVKNAHLHGLGVGPRKAHDAMMAFIAEHQIRPVISERYGLDRVHTAMQDLLDGGHFGKLVIDF